jgi:tetratricopeptide (TPR) repeat protein
MNYNTLFLIVITVFLGVFPIQATEITAEKEYARCIELAKSKPQRGFDAAIAWLGLGGGNPANHCMAVALMELGQHKEAARLLVKLAKNTRLPKEFKAALLGQAGQAWLLAGNTAQANNILTAAIKLDPINWNLYVDRAQVAAMQEDLARSLVDLDKVINNAPDFVDALVFRASAMRQLGQYDRAAIDIGRALTIEKNHLEGLLERGILRLRLKDTVGARTDWLNIIKILPNSETARIARANIQRMNGPKIK